MTKITYYFDAYCGWCYGFNQEMTAFLASQPDIEVDVVAGVLFTEDRPLQQMAEYVQPINQRIEQIFGVSFGEDYAKALNSSQAMNSIYPAAAFAWAKNSLSNRELYAFSREMFKLFFVQGKDLALVETYTDLLAEFGLTNKQAELAQALANPHSLAQQEANLTAQAGVQGFPTIRLIHQGKQYDLRQNGEYSSAILSQRVKQIL